MIETKIKEARLVVTLEHGRFEKEIEYSLDFERMHELGTVIPVIDKEGNKVDLPTP